MSLQPFDIQHGNNHKAQHTCGPLYSVIILFEQLRTYDHQQSYTHVEEVVRGGKYVTKNRNFNFFTLSKEICLGTFSYHAFKKTDIQVKAVLCMCKENPVWRKNTANLCEERVHMRKENMWK